MYYTSVQFCTSIIFYGRGGPVTNSDSARLPLLYGRRSVARPENERLHPFFFGECRFPRYDSRSFHKIPGVSFDFLPVRGFFAILRMSYPYHHGTDRRTSRMRRRPGMSPMRRTFSIKTLGCKLNQYESALIARQFATPGGRSGLSARRWMSSSSTPVP